MIRALKDFLLHACILCCLACALFGQEFTADLITKEDAGMALPAGKVFVGKDKARIETQGMGGMGRVGGVLIVDLTAQTSVILMPQRKMYMQTMTGQGLLRTVMLFRPSNIDNPCPEWLKLANKPDSTCEKIGPDVVNGRDTVKYEGKSADGVAYIWVDKKVKFVTKWQETGRSGELGNIQEASQPAELFEIPADYQKIGGRMPHPAPPAQ